jgi:phosphatidylglycerophosphate synthase
MALEQLSGLRSKLLAPFLFKANPVIISIISLLFAIFTGYLFFLGSWSLGALTLIISAVLDALDGEIARKYKVATKFGDLLDHTFDRIADAAIFIGLAFSKQIPVTHSILTLLALIAILLASYAGTEAQALMGKRLYTALVGRADRLVILFVAALLMPFYTNAMFYAILAIGILSVLTFFQRTIKTAITLKR